MVTSGDYRPALSLAFGASMALITAGVTVAFAGAALPAVLAVGAVVGLGAAASGALFDAWIYDDWDNFGANLAGGGAELGLGVVGGAIGGKAGWALGTLVGAGVGQITTNMLSGQDWDQGLLASVFISGVADAGGAAIGHGLGSRFGSQANSVQPKAAARWDPQAKLWRDAETGQVIPAVEAIGIARQWDDKKGWVYPPKLNIPGLMPDGTMYRPGDVIAPKHLTDGRPVKIVDQLSGREVTIEEAARWSGTPKEYLENISREVQGTGVLCGLRNCHKTMETQRTQTWPKDTNAKVYDILDAQSKLKVSSAADPRFKTNPETGLVQITYKMKNKAGKDIEVHYGLIGGPNARMRPGQADADFKLVRMNQIVDEAGNIIWDYKNGIPMGPDVDTNYYLFITDKGRGINLGTDTPAELVMRRLMAKATGDQRPHIGEMPAVGHGPGQPYFGNVITWDDTLNVMPDGRFIWTIEREIEPLFIYFGLSTRQRGPFGKK